MMEGEKDAGVFINVEESYRLNQKACGLSILEKCIVFGAIIHLGFIVTALI